MKEGSEEFIKLFPCYLTEWWQGDAWVRDYHVLGTRPGCGHAEMIPFYDRRTRVLLIRFLLIIRGHGSRETQKVPVLKFGKRYISEVLEIMRDRIMSSKQISLDFILLTWMLEIFLTNDLFSLNLSCFIHKIKVLSKLILKVISCCDIYEPFKQLQCHKRDIQADVHSELEYMCESHMLGPLEFCSASFSRAELLLESTISLSHLSGV